MNHKHVSSETHHQTASNDGIWSCQRDQTVFPVDDRLAFVISFNIAQVTNMSAVTVGE